MQVEFRDPGLPSKSFNVAEADLPALLSDQTHISAGYTRVYCTVNGKQRLTYRGADAVEAYRRYYIGDKLTPSGRPARWTRRSPPNWIPGNVTVSII